MKSDGMVTGDSSPERGAPMAAAPFVWRTDGRPDWRSMWTSFCELALFGGPPHRGPEQALHGPRANGPGAASDPEMVAEMRRGIWETTGLYSELGDPGWIAITCESRAMAEWLGAAIVLENVEARVEDDRLLLPAGPRFRLEDQVKSIITVVAKTHHYGAIHGGIARRGDAPGARYRFRCVSCGLEVVVSRPASGAELGATCPLDGARMARSGPVTTDATLVGGAGSLSRGPGPLRLGVAGSTDARTALIDALRRRYGRRRAVVASAALASEVSDHAVDLVLIDLGEGGEAPGVVDATIGVIAASALAGALHRDGGLDRWHLLVVDTAGRAKADLSRLEEDTSRWHDRCPVAFVDLVTGGGIDVVVSWLQRALGLDPWRARA